MKTWEPRLGVSTTERRGLLSTPPETLSTDSGGIPMHRTVGSFVPSLWRIGRASVMACGSVVAVVSRVVVEVAISSPTSETKTALIVFHRNDRLGSQALIPLRGGN